MYDDNIQKTRKHRRTVTLLVSNEPGMLSRISGLFMRRNFNIDTLTVAASTTQEVSRMTISFLGDDKSSEQLTKQLHKIVNIIKVNDLPEQQSIIRDLALIKVHTKNLEHQNKVMAYCQAHKANIVNVNREDMVIEVAGSPAKIDSFLELVRPFGIKEIARTGSTGMSRGSTSFEKA